MPLIPPVLIDTKLPFPSWILYAHPLQLWRSAVGVLSAPRTALAQISSLRHGLLTPSVGFRQRLTRPSRGEKDCNQSLATIPFDFAGKSEGRGGDSAPRPIGFKVPSGGALLSFQRGESAEPKATKSMGDLGARHSRGWGGSHMVLYGAFHGVNTWIKYLRIWLQCC